MKNYDDITNDLLDRMAAQPKFCPQFHLSLQSGNDATLKRMNRHYDFAFYKDLVERIRQRFTNSAITTDVMVGFAGETDEDFADSLPLPIAGLMSNKDAYDVAHKLDILHHMANALGCELKSPFMTMAFMALLVIPSIKISDKGLFDGDAFEFIDVIRN